MRVGINKKEGEVKPTKKDLKRVIKQEPTLSDIGVNSSASDRQNWPVDFKSFKICCKWLLKFKQIKSPQLNSYYLKHVVERLAGEYVSNGSLIAAAIHLKIPLRLYPDWPNALIAISRKCPYVMQDRRMCNDTRGIQLSGKANV